MATRHQKALSSSSRTSRAIAASLEGQGEVGVTFSPSSQAAWSPRGSQVLGKSVQPYPNQLLQNPSREEYVCVEVPQGIFSTIGGVSQQGPRSSLPQV